MTSAIDIYCSAGILFNKYGEGADGKVKCAPAKVVGCKRRVMSGNPSLTHISTSFVERQNLNMRMAMRRFTRLTNAFSKKVQNLEHAISLHFMYYNFARIHQSLRVSPALEAGVTDRLWSLEDIAALTE